ncbi:hypothetical protein EVJ50_04145 [Synechococcus sp. RSCCF101]|uniref:glycoside hydrolase family 9 protein n=1 Tax=Synechococcus sp. RSCCF101 TaxID=2511069 RepID=UPI001246D0C8|nr:glycoside hydrolase family 9 protein [Synechococcus sp. RSCCF101]QEY31565.1 hypothetical protein EVJ50_04145 [Synechococcus sp. RSCCF101]
MSTASATAVQLLANGRHSTDLELALAGSIWWGGFTAELTLINRGDVPINDWTIRFVTPHRLEGDPWGATAQVEPGVDGLNRIRLSGSDWAASIPAGGSIRIGFNGRQGVDLGAGGSLSLSDLVASGVPENPPEPDPIEPQPGPPADAPPADAPPADGPAAAADLAVTVGGTRWWDGFTAELTIENRSGRDLSGWSLSFDSVHFISDTPWGASLRSEDLGNGVTRYHLSGDGWGAVLPAGQAVTVGFNGQQGRSIGNSGALEEAMLWCRVDGAAAIPGVDPSPPQDSPAPMDPPAPAEPQPVPDSPSAEPPPPGTGEPPSTGAPINAAEALQLSLLFYEANRSGDLDETSNRIDWRGDSGLTDGRDGVYFGGMQSENLQPGLSLDLSGGYHDAGDHGKFGLPLASSLMTLAWGGLEYADGFALAGETDALLETVRWGTDYLLRAHEQNPDGSTRFLVAQVGDVAADHALWSAPETQTILRPALAITPDQPGSDLAGITSAALSSASVLFRQAGESAYADTLLEEAEALHDFAHSHRGRYSDSIPEVQAYYNSFSGDEDELTLSSAWLARALEADGQPGHEALRQQALQRFESGIGGLSAGWTHNWDDSSYAAAVLLAQDSEDPALRASIETWLDSWQEGGNGVQLTEGGLRFISPWGSLRYMANTALLAGIYTDTVTGASTGYDLLVNDSVAYILGDNPLAMSYVVGYGDRFPLQPHHRAASGVGWEDFESDQPNRHVLHGALVGGPSAASDTVYVDRRSDYISNEVALDYNAGLVGALARSVQTLGGTPLSDQQLDALPGVSVPGLGGDASSDGVLLPL